MRSLILLSLIAFSCSVDPLPPVWPNVWSQDFVVNYTSAGGVYTVGRHWYDYSNNNQRVTYQNGQYEAICGSILPDTNTACTQLITNGNLYVVFPQKQQCCRCCDGASGCTVKNPKWLQPFKYVGEEAINGEQFFKWNYDIVNYYAKQNQQRIPRKIQVAGLKTQDFIMNTYSQEPIQKEIFQLPAYCNKDCSRSTICGKLEPGKSLKTE